jgi:hypothetical protein
MSHSEGVSTPAWVERYRETLIKEALNDDLSVRSYALIGQPSSFPLSSKGEQATLTKIDGVDTDHALAVGRITRADYLEYCERDPGGLTTRYGGRLSVTQCIRVTERGVGRTTFTSRANCKAKQVTLWDGTWRFLSYDQGSITWTNPKGQVEEPWGGTAAVQAQFELLCPNTLARIRADQLTAKAGSSVREPVTADHLPVTEATSSEPVEVKVHYVDASEKVVSVLFEARNRSRENLERIEVNCSIFDVGNLPIAVAWGIVRNIRSGEADRDKVSTFTERAHLAKSATCRVVSAR